MITKNKDGGWSRRLGVFRSDSGITFFGKATYFISAEDPFHNIALKALDRNDYVPFYIEIAKRKGSGRTLDAMEEMIKDASETTSGYLDQEEITLARVKQNFPVEYTLTQCKFLLNGTDDHLPFSSYKNRSLKFFSLGPSKTNASIFFPLSDPFSCLPIRFSLQ